VWKNPDLEDIPDYEEMEEKRLSLVFLTPTFMITSG